MKKYIFGGFGCNNIGDDIIFDGANVVYEGKLIPIYVNKANRPGSIRYSDFYNGIAKFDNTIADELIIGGGGLLHCKGAVEDDLKMARLAKAAGLKVSVQRFGAESLEPEWEQVTKDFLSEAYYISVRTTTSRDIVNTLGFKCEVVPDFAYSYNQISDRKFDLPRNGKPNILLTTSYLNDDDFHSLSNLVVAILHHVNILYLPHSKAHRHWESNDVITGEKLWSSININESDREDCFKVLPYIDDPSEVLTLYGQVDGVISGRYHSSVFADIKKKPLLVLNPKVLKYQAFLEDNANKGYQGLDLNSDLRVIEKTLFAFIQRISLTDSTIGV